jgi:nitrate/nitrite transporter NarK
MITAWGFGGVLGPQLISWAYDATGAYWLAFYIIAGIMLVASIIPFIIRPPKGEAEVGPTFLWAEEEASPSS